MGDVYPAIEPYEAGMLEVGESNQVYWETCGNPEGKPAVVLHGGPGSGCTSWHRRLFDPERYRIVLFDQRGSGRSLPHAGDYETDLTANTTRHLLIDLELLRSSLGVERWLVYGNSWGSTLALAYAQQRPEHVSEMVLLAVTMTRHSEIDWLYHGARRFFPEAWERFQAGVPRWEQDGDLVEAYHRLLEDPDVSVRERAALDWCSWEDTVAALRPDTPPNPRYRDPRFRMAFARIVTHYFHHRAWLEEGILLRNAGRLSGIPGVLIQGRLDIGGPPITAWQLSRAWPDSKLVLLNAGHSSSDLGMEEAVVAATDAFARRPRSLS